MVTTPAAGGGWMAAGDSAADVEAGVDQHRQEAVGLPHTDGVVAVDLVDRGAGHRCSRFCWRPWPGSPVVPGHHDRGGDISTAVADV